MRDTLCLFFDRDWSNFFLIDKRVISEGSTVANTGLLQFSND